VASRLASVTKIPGQAAYTSSTKKCHIKCHQKMVILLSWRQLPPVTYMHASNVPQTNSCSVQVRRWHHIIMSCAVYFDRVETATQASGRPVAGSLVSFYKRPILGPLYRVYDAGFLPSASLSDFSWLSTPSWSLRGDLKAETSKFLHGGML
jgi:hypothetical protein